ncbi:NAD-dependent epimerase/dehydratase family protein, partial [Candidatus Pelagibacter ubique]|nr:NAD-dependent epimerase/dehydratase family protein [Candidatus Pelagibacter ubique]
KMLLSGKLEYTNEPYAIAKIAGIKLCESYNIQYKTNYKCLMPCNSYGPNDNYDTKNSHFFAALIKKIYLAKKNNKKSITIWGSGKPKRELIFVNDIADACIFFMNKKIPSTLINIGTGNDKTILEYAKILMLEFKVKLKIKFDKTKPDGVKKKLLNIDLAKKYGWTAKTSLNEGIKRTLESLN